MERYNKIEEIFCKRCLVYNVPIPDDTALQAVVLAWAEILEPIKTGQLEHFYKEAVRNKDGSYPVTAKDIYLAFEPMDFMSRQARATNQLHKSIKEKYGQDAVASRNIKAF